MVLTAPRRQALTPALIVPDEQTWTVAGSDPAARGLVPVFALGEARRLVIPDSVPAPLGDALRACVAALPVDVEVETGTIAGLSGGPWKEAAHAGHEEEATGHDTDGDHGEHDEHHDHDMMAIVGEPSADGLVMEPVELRFGPLATPLPGGLAVDVRLDGDVVADATVHALLEAGSPAGDASAPPDLLAPVAWRLTIEAAREEAVNPGWRRLAALEAERAVSHLAWLRALGRLLGWRPLVDRCTYALEGLPPLAHELAAASAPEALAGSTALAAVEKALPGAGAVAELVARSRALRLRTAGLGVVTGARASRLGGPAARAGGLPHDARSGDPRYERLGFDPIVQAGGDAHARTVQRAEEALQALQLAAAALRQEAARAPVPAAPGNTLEGPRGPLRAQRGPDGWRLAAPGAQAAPRAAGEAMAGTEWSAALVALASFDLSPWRVGP